MTSHQMGAIECLHSGGTKIKKKIIFAIDFALIYRNPYLKVWLYFKLIQIYFIFAFIFYYCALIFQLQENGV